VNQLAEQEANQFRENAKQYAHDVMKEEQDRLRFLNFVDVYLRFHASTLENLEIDIHQTKKRCDECDYKNVKGETFFDKADFYIWQRTKIAKWVIGAVSGLILSFIVYLFLQNSSAMERNYKLLLDIKDQVTIFAEKVTANTGRINNLEDTIYRKR
jgi:hypothetical protein